jgi:hypothetical protein
MGIVEPLNRRTLAMVATAALLAGACTHSARDRFVFESVAEPTGKLFIKTFDGAVNVEVDPAARRVHGVVEVVAAGFDDSGRARQAASEVRLVESGPPQDLSLIVDLPPTSRRSERFAVSLNLSVPVGVTVSVVTDNAPIRVVALPVLTLETTAGSVELVDTEGLVRIRTDNGHIAVDGHTGEIDAVTLNAPVDLYGVVGNVDVATANGPVTARVLPPRGGEVRLATTNGLIDVAVPFDFGAQLFATTSAAPITIDGLDFYPTYEGPDQLQGELFDGFGRMDLRTTNGPISLHRL